MLRLHRTWSSPLKFDSSVIEEVGNVLLAGDGDNLLLDQAGTGKERVVQRSVERPRTEVVAMHTDPTATVSTRSEPHAEIGDTSLGKKRARIEWKPGSFPI